MIEATTIPKQYITISTTQPSGGTEGELWYNSTSDILYTYDGSSWNSVETAVNYINQGIAENNIEIIELQANASITPIDHDTLISETFSDATGYLNLVETANTDAIFANARYNAYTTLFSDTCTRENSATVGNGWVETETGGVCTIDTNKIKVVRSDGSCGVTQTFAIATPEYIKFKITNSNVTQLINVDFKNSGTSVINVASYNSKIQSPYNTDRVDAVNSTEYTVELKNINYTAHTYDLWVDNVEIATGISFENDEAGITDMITNNGGGGATNTAQFDDIYIGGYGAGVVEIDLPATITGTITHTQLVINGDTITGVTYDLLDSDSTEDAGLAINTKNGLTTCDGAKILSGKIQLHIPAGSDIKTFALKLWK